MIMCVNDLTHDFEKDSQNRTMKAIQDGKCGKNAKAD